MSISRRQAVTLGAAGLVSATTIPFAQWIGSAGAQSMRTRYDAASTEGKKMLAIYASAVGEMKKRPPTDPHSWQFQFFTHWMPEDKTAAIDRIYGAGMSPEKMAAEAMWNTCRGHKVWKGQSDWFVPWHRMYVLYLERIVRQVSGKQDFTLPYWNYTDPAKTLIPEEFRDKASPLYVADRKPGINEGTTGMQGLSLSFMARKSYLDTQVSGFNRTLDGNPHGSVHVQVGTDTNMGDVPTAANDPVFWVHHAQIDRCWASWNAAGGKNPAVSGWTGREFQFYDPVQNKLVTVPTEAFTTTEKLGYVYQDLIPSQTTPALTAMVSPDKLRDTAAIVLAGGVERSAAPSGPIRLGAEAVTANVTPPPMRLSNALESAETRLWLVVDKLATDLQPGVLYDVYLGGAEVAETRAEAWKVGQINFFNAVTEAAEEDSSVLFSFDITDHIQVLLGEAGDGMETPQVTFAPVGTPKAGAQPLIGEIRLVRE